MILIYTLYFLFLYLLYLFIIARINQPLKIYKLYTFIFIKRIFNIFKNNSLKVISDNNYFK